LISLLVRVSITVHIQSRRNEPRRVRKTKQARKLLNATAN